jgi:hypothetical protein
MPFNIKNPFKKINFNQFTKHTRNPLPSTPKLGGVGISFID